MILLVKLLCKEASLPSPTQIPPLECHKPKAKPNPSLLLTRRRDPTTPAWTPAFPPTSSYRPGSVARTARDAPRVRYTQPGGDSRSLIRINAGLKLRRSLVKRSSHRQRQRTQPSQGVTLDHWDRSHRDRPCACVPRERPRYERCRPRSRPTPGDQPPSARSPRPSRLRWTGWGPRCWSERPRSSPPCRSRR